ncbi:hypothetical protein M9H77_25425 [Catharanthus roseus]|uniref:Uncharacterized protein n=1 Tax=Catharanthus roseus TaxID=4058 RepID=A0ACC0A850_CATRO|nr:hypothetical protein M9H77_25425 [Catharanthus roseus]
MFYLATTTLASGTGGVPKQSIVTRSRAAIGADTKGVNASHSGKSLRGLREQFVQASIESDDIHDLLRDDPFAQTCEGAKDEDGVLSTREGQRSHSIPDFEHTPSRVSTTPQVFPHEVDYHLVAPDAETGMQYRSFGVVCYTSQFDGFIALPMFLTDINELEESSDEKDEK